MHVSQAPEEHQMNIYMPSDHILWVCVCVSLCALGQNTSYVCHNNKYMTCMSVCVCVHTCDSVFSLDIAVHLANNRAWNCHLTSHYWISINIKAPNIISINFYYCHYQPTKQPANQPNPSKSLEINVAEWECMSVSTSEWEHNLVNRSVGFSTSLELRSLYPSPGLLFFVQLQSHFVLTLK